MQAFEPSSEIHCDPNTIPRAPMGFFFPYGIAIFCGAFLLFQVQLIIGKYILPWFGGAVSVWTTCMLFFQVLLLAGYIYAHLLITRIPLRSQVKFHLGLIGISFFLLGALSFFWPSPITPGGNWKSIDPGAPIGQIVFLLAAAVGLPFFLLSTTNPLLQGWIAQNQGHPPYRLFALSNGGSLLGLLSYPFLFEPHLSLFRQAWIWSLAYGFYGLLVLSSALSVFRGGGAETKKRGVENRASIEDLALWVFLSACACALFLATTNMLCQEIAVIPFLWVLPFSLYLISFIAAFESQRWYRRSLFHPLYLVGFILLAIGGKSGVLSQVAIYSLALFVMAMICHGELARRKPPTQDLTIFYLMVALGGAFGGVFVALAAPLIFPALWEFQIVYLAGGALILWILFRDRVSWLHQGTFGMTMLLFIAVVMIVEIAFPFFPKAGSELPSKGYRLALYGIGALWIFFPFLRSREFSGGARKTQGFAIVLLVLIGFFFAGQMRSQRIGSFARFRSFYGAFRIEKKENAYLLRHGTTTHGWQIRDGIHDPTPTSYYATNTGIGILLWDHPKRKQSGGGSKLRVGVIGLGVGTLAAYGRPGDFYCFYEIDPAIAKVANDPRGPFTFLKNSPAEIEIVLGDGRLSLEREASLAKFRNFDVLVVDAFSSDSIPVHLLTREAMEIYLKHLRGPESVLAFHISNRILDLVPVLLGLKSEFGLSLLIADTEEGPVTSSCRWGLFSREAYSLHLPRLERRARNFPELSPLLWTDDYSNLFRVVKRGAWLR